jgi:hypothetical protein
MAGKTNYAETKTLDGWFGNTALPSNGTLWFALYTVAPGESGGGTEVTGNGYARASITNNTTNFPAATAADPSTKSNNASITFPTVTTADWTGIVAWAVLDAVTAGNMLYFGTFASTQAVSVGRSRRTDLDD